jgi:organic hydroperoxide reductase OsmC/OhrA
MHHHAKIAWQKNAEELFLDNRYSRVHQWTFDGGVTVPASASPKVVPLPLSDENAVDPEEAFIAAIASCHMLLFLSIAAQKKYVVISYEDEAEGILEKNNAGQMTMTRIDLHPQIIFSDPTPTREEVKEMHNIAHARCFLASAVRSEINIITK